MELFMSQKIDLKAADRKVFTASLDDGLIDIFLSSVVLMFAVGVFLSEYLGDFWSSAIFLPLWGALYLILRWIRKYVIIPRIGIVKWGADRKRKLSIFTVLMLALNISFFLLGIFFFITPGGPDWLGSYKFSAMFSIQILVLFSTAGYFLDLPRLYVYGLMLGLAPLVGEWLYQTYKTSHHGFPITFGLSALIIFATGLYKFINTLLDNPLPAENPAH
jgi:hypothetical protein